VPRPVFSVALAVALAAAVAVPRPVLAVVVAVALAGASAACRHSVLVVDNAPKPDEARATLSGTVTTPNGHAPIPGRVVAAIEQGSARRYQATTNPAGGFTLLVEPGTYRLEVALQPGEGVVDPPSNLTVSRAEIKSGIQLKVGKTG
jgi:hypothetical protein